MITKDEENIICVACENYTCDYFTIFNGYLMCSYCVDDWLNTKNIDFSQWLRKQRNKMRKDRNE